MAQTSPVGRHPLGGWQMDRPLGPKGAQEWLQQKLLLQSGAPVHTVPAMAQPPEPAPLGTAQMPSAAPATL